VLQSLQLAANPFSAVKESRQPQAVAVFELHRDSGVGTMTPLQALSPLRHYPSDAFDSSSYPALGYALEQGQVSALVCASL